GCVGRRPRAYGGTHVTATWATDDQPDYPNPVRKVEDAFDGMKRARKRKVVQAGDHSWTVIGDQKLGDSYPEYAVTLPPAERRYTCACYFHAAGDTRQHRVCSHVKAVVLWRARRKVVERAKDRLRKKRGEDPPAAAPASRA